MSRIGKAPVAIPRGVTVTVADRTIKVKGPKGELSLDLVALVDASVEGEELILTRQSADKKTRAFHGLMRAHAANMVHGVTEGFTKRLEVQGIGYRAEVKGNTLVMNLGYSHQVVYPIPAGIGIEVSKDNKISISGIDRGQVGQVAADIRDFRSPDRYKGKGIRYEGEHIALKAGKSA